jgi:hypothetical protein
MLTISARESFISSRIYLKDISRNVALKRANENPFSQAFPSEKKDEKFPVDSKDLSVL